MPAPGELVLYSLPFDYFYLFKESKIVNSLKLIVLCNSGNI